MKRAILITKGRVQRVGYRDLMDTAAKSLKVLIKTTAMMNGNLGNKIDEK